MNNDFRIGTWLVQPSLNTISRHGTTTRVEPKVMQVLVCLAGRPGEALSKETLFQTVWPDTFVTDDALKRCISDLRRVFEDEARDPKIIETIPKRGYRLVAPVRPVNGSKEMVAPFDSFANIPTHKRMFWWGAVGITAVLLLLALIATLRFWLGERFSSPGELSEIRSVAVLPLQNLSGDPAQDYFSDGITDALINDLAQIGSLKVISRTSSLQYKQTKKKLPEIARELNVDGIIEGTVQRLGDRVRITAQLISGSSDKHLWAKSYERDTREVFALERDVTQDIAGSLQAKLALRPQAVQTLPRQVDFEALEAYVQGTYHLHGRGHGGGDDELMKARAYFQQAVDLDPNFAPSYIGLAMTYWSVSHASSDDLVSMRKFAQKAAALDPGSGDAHVVLGDAKLENWDWVGAETEYRRALALNPNSANAHEDLGCVLDTMGHLDEGWKEFAIAQQLDPNEDRIADPLYRRGQFDRAIEIRRRIALRDPGDGYNHYALAMNYAQKGMFKEFAAEMDTAADLYGIPEVAHALRRGYAASGRRGALTAWANELEQLAATRKLYLPGAMADAYAALGNNDRAFYWLEQYRKDPELAIADPITGDLKDDPWLLPLHSDPRFSEFLQRAGLPH